jgi:uncharacterized protein (TIGR04255 family)
VHYKKAPILEAVLEFRWPSDRSVEDLSSALKNPVFTKFEDPKQRFQIDAAINVEADDMSYKRQQVGFEIAVRDGSERVFLDQGMFVYIKSAPYDRWKNFSKRALALLEPVVTALEVEEFSRVGVRFVNRIDVPYADSKGIDTDRYITIRFDGPRLDKGIIDEFQMRVVKPTERDGIHYALIVATATSPLPDHSAIVLDIDVFTKTTFPSFGDDLINALDEMREEKNEIFEACLTDESRALFGGFEE